MLFCQFFKEEVKAFTQSVGKEMFVPIWWQYRAWDHSMEVCLWLRDVTGGTWLGDGWPSPPAWAAQPLFPKRCKNQQLHFFSGGKKELSESTWDKLSFL